MRTKFEFFKPSPISLYARITKQRPCKLAQFTPIPGYHTKINLIDQRVLKIFHRENVNDDKNADTHSGYKYLFLAENGKPDGETLMVTYCTVGALN